MVARIQVPGKVKRGDAIEIRVAIQQPMETGYRMVEGGRAITRNVIRDVVCRYKGSEVFRADLSSGISANPLLQFFIVARDTGEIEIEWVDDKGERGSERQLLVVAS